MKIKLLKNDLQKPNTLTLVEENKSTLKFTFVFIHNKTSGLDTRLACLLSSKRLSRTGKIDLLACPSTAGQARVQQLSRTGKVGLLAYPAQQGSKAPTGCLFLTRLACLLCKQGLLACRASKESIDFCPQERKVACLPSTAG